MTLLLSCSKEKTEIVDISEVAYKEFFEFKFLLDHVIEVDFNKRTVMLYTRTLDGCLREATEQDGIAIPVRVLEIKGSSMLVELSSGAVTELTKSKDGKVLGISGLPNVAVQVLPWLITKCNGD